MMFNRLRFSTIGLAALCLAGGYAWQQLWLGVGVAVLLGGLGLLGEWRGWGWLASLMLIAFFGLAGAGAWLDSPAWLMLLAAVSALAAWDLAHFQQQQQSTTLADEAGWQRLHLQRLGLVTGVSLLLGLVALTLQLQLNLLWAIVLGLLLIIGLGRIWQAV